MSYMKRCIRSSSCSVSVLSMGLFAFVMTPLQSAPSWKPLTDQTSKKPLAYLRSPLPWQGLLGEEKLLSAWKAALLDKVIPKTVLGKASREVLMRVQSSMEFLVLPPANRFLPIPSMVVSMDMSGGDERKNLLEQWVIATMSQIQGSPATWLKFKDVPSDKAGRQIREVFLPGGRCWVQLEGKRVTLFYSSDMDFLESFEMAESEKNPGAPGLTLTREDFQWMVQPQAAFSFYDGWLKRAAKPMHQAYLSSSWSKVKSFEVHTEGQGPNFKAFGSLKWSPSKDSLFALLPKRAKKVELLKGGFRGSVMLPALNAESWSHQLPKLLLATMPNLPSLLSSIEDVSFVWSEKNVSPIMKLVVKDAKSFDAGLSSILGSKVIRTKEGRWHHLSWGENRLSYQVEGTSIWFSPLRHALQDMGQKEALLSGERPELWVEYPLSGRLSGNHYSLMHLYLQLALLKGKGLNPNFYPAFAEQKVKDVHWKGMGGLELTVGEDRLDLRWSQPYGLSGLMGGIQLQSSSWAYFLSLLQLTKHSF